MNFKHLQFKVTELRNLDQNLFFKSDFFNLKLIGQKLGFNTPLMVLMQEEHVDCITTTDQCSQ